jgi:Xaa-Pro aminopeptidase
VRTHVSLAGPPILAVRIDDDGDMLYVANNEFDRLAAEELCEADAARTVRVPWQIPPGEAAFAAGAAAGESVVARELRAARAALLPAERDRYRALGRDTAVVLTDVLAGARPEDSEQALSAEIARGLLQRGIDPLVVLVAGSGRLGFRHPLPTSAVLGERAMAVVCGRRHGLIANATRWVGAAVDDRILEVERAFLDASTPGRTVHEAFADGIAGYAAHGFEPQEWRRHHQGGPTGYAGRDPRATADTDDTLVEWQAFAWNPTAPGVKVEDTVLRTPDGWEILTVDPRWPTADVAGLARPVALPFAVGGR